MEQNYIISGRILTDMTDGVIAVDLTGTIITFNPAAEAILGIRQEDAVKRSFAELFLANEENDAFCQTILDAVYESSTSHNRIVPYHNGVKQLALALTTTFMSAKDDSGRKVGVIAVFSDITELQQLQAAEARMAEELRVKHRELQAAYLKTEEGNQQLQAALKKVHIIRITATAFTIILFLGIGLFVWNRKPATFRSAPSPGKAGVTATVTIPVTPQPVSTTIALSGKMQPLQMVNLTSPLSGKVGQFMVRYGDLVQAGRPLVTMDTAEAQVKLREARAAYIKAKVAYENLVKWDSSADIARANRSIAKARLELENKKKTVEENERLFKKGIIPATEYESSKHQYTNQQMDFQSAQEELKAAIDKGNAENLKVARYEMENAEARLKQIERDVEAAVVTAPVSGIVMKAPGSGQAKEGKSVERGASFQQGDVLLAIGDLTGFAVSCKVDEVDVTKVKLGQKVRVTGDAFPGEQLTGAIQSISPHAEEGDVGKNTASFGIRVVIDSIPPELKKRIMVGMSANLDIIIYEKPDALMVPLSAVKDEQGKRYVLRKKAGNAAAPAEKVEVTTGYTTQDAVEITKGLKPGDLIEIAEPVAPAVGPPPPGGGPGGKK